MANCMLKLNNEIKPCDDQKTLASPPVIRNMKHPNNALCAMEEMQNDGYIN